MRVEDVGTELELLGKKSSLEVGVVLGGRLVAELEAGVELELLGTESSPEADEEFGRALAMGVLEVGTELELPGTESSLKVGVVLGVRLVAELEAGIELELEFCGELDTGAGFPEPVTQFGSRSAAVAGAGPLVTATQPGRYGMGPMTFSEGFGLGAAHEFITASETKRFSFSNTGQFSITPELSVHV